MEIDFHAFLRSLMKVIEAKDFYTAGHSDRVADIAEKLADIAGFSQKDVEIVHIASHLHDIGKIGVPDYILSKKDVLLPEEYEKLKEHSLIGWNILKEIGGIGEIAACVRSHHERPDGSGYPDGLFEHEIPEGALIIGVADAFDAMTSHRTYNDLKTSREAIDEIERLRGRQFAGFAVDALLVLSESGYFKDMEVSDEGTLSSYLRV